MYKLCKTESSAKRQRKIELALLTLMKSTKFDDITVSQICESMSMPRKAFYRYFDSKEGALNALIDHTLLEFQDFGGDYRKTEHRSLERDLEQFFIFWQNKSELINAVEHSNLSGILIEKSMKYCEGDMVDTQKFLPRENNWMRLQVFRFAICGLMTAMLEWYHNGFKESTRDMAKLACRLLSAPLFSDLSNLK